MTQGGNDVLETLVTRFTADLAPLQAGFQQAAQMSQQAGQQSGQRLQQGLSSALSGAGMGGVGQQVGQQLGAGVTTGATTQIRNARGQFTAAGQQAGQAIGQGVAQGVTPGLGQAQTQVRGLTSALASAQSQGGSVFQGFTRGIQSSGIIGQLGGVGGGLNSVLSGMGGVTMAGGPLVASIGGVTAALGASLVAINNSINEYARYETTLARISTLTDKTVNQLGGVGYGLKELARETGQSVEALGRSMQEVLGASVAGSEDLNASMRLVAISAKLAVGGFVDSAVAVDGLTSVLNSYKMSVNDAQKVADAMSKTVLVGKISFQELATSLGMVTSISSTAGVALNEVLAAIATMTAGGLQGGQSIEYLRTMLGNILAPSSQAQKLAKQLGLEFDEQALKAKGLTGVLKDVMDKTDGSAGKLKILFGDVGAVAAATAIATGDFSRMNDSLKQINQSAGATNEAFGKVTNTIDEQGKKVQQSWKTLWQNVGEIFAPFKAAFLDDIGNMLNSVNELLEKFNLARRNSANQSGLELARTDLMAQEGRATRLRADLNNPNASARDRAIAERDLSKVEANVRRLRAEVANLEGAIAAASADRDAARLGTVSGGIVGEGPLLPGQQRLVQPESGKFALSFISTLAETFKNDPRVASDCAIIAYEVLNKLGVKIKGTAVQNAWVPSLEKNAVASGFTKQSEAKPGDLVIFKTGNGISYGAGSGMHAGVVAGYGPQGQLLVLDNPGTQANGRDGTTRVRAIGADAQNATFYRAPTSPYAPNTSRDNPNAPTPMVTAEQIAQAQRLTDALAAAKKARDDNPGVAKFVQGVITAERALTAFQKASTGNAEALKALGNQASKTGGSYLATAAEIGKYGNDALRLVKDLEAAEQSGNAATRAAAQARVDAWIGEDKARKSVFDLESRAYATRQQQRTQDNQRQKEAQAQAAAVNEAIRQNNVAAARAALTELERLRDTGFQKVKGNLVAELAVEKQYADLIYKAKKAVLDKERADRDADIRNSKLPEGVKTQQLAISKQTYDTALAQAATDKLTRLDTARTASGEAAAQAELDRNTQLNASTIEAMRVRTQAQEQMERAAQDALEAGENANTRIIAGMQKVDAAMTAAAQAALDRAQADADRLKNRLIEIEQDTLNVQAAGNKSVADGVIADAAKLADREDFGGALTVLQNGLDRLMTSALNGEPAAEGIDALVTAINNLTDARARWRAEEQRIAGAELALTDPLKPNPARINGSIRDTSAPVPDGGPVAARGQRPAPRMNPDGTEYVDPGVAARDPNAAQRAADWEAVMRAERVDAYRESLKKLDLTQLEAAKSAAILAQDATRYQMIQAAIAAKLEGNADATKKAEAAAQTLITAQDALAEAMGQTKAPYADQIKSLEALRGEAGVNQVELQKLIDKFKELQGAALKNEGLNKWLNYAAQIGGAMQSIGGSLDGDLGANVAGFGKALGTAAGIAQDIVAQNYVGAAIKAFSALADAIGGFQKANAQAAKQQADFNKQFTFLDGDQYGKTFTRSRGFFADLFGGGPEVVQEIDNLGLLFAKSLEGGFVNGIKNGLKEGLAKNDLSIFTKSLKESVGNAILEGLVDSFIQTELLKNIIAPAIKAWSDAMKTTNDPTDDIVARAGLTSAVEQANALGQAFAKDAMPLLQPLRDQGYFGSDSESGGTSGTGSLFGSTPGVALAIPRIEVTLPAELTRPLGDFAVAVPVFDQASRRLLEVADRLLQGAGTPRMSGLGGLT